jgi:2-hydroxymuconate-semialdehyde hydrolase
MKEIRLIAMFIACAVLLAACVITPATQSTIKASDVMSLQLSDGQFFAYRVAGKNHTATPILLIHGIPDASDSWSSTAAELARTHPVYAVDLAGYGYSDRPKDYDVSLSAQANYLLEFLDKLGLEQVIIAGHDIGGGIAQIFAARNPLRVEKLVLINTVIDDHWPVFEMRLLRVPLFGYMSLALMERPMWEHVLKKGYFNSDMVTDAVIHRYQHWYQGSSGRWRLIHNARALNSADLSGLSATIRALPIPTLILWGCEDRYLDAEPPKKLCHDMKHCRFEFINNAGHFVMDEQPQRVSSFIQKFLEPLADPN